MEEVGALRPPGLLWRLRESMVAARKSFKRWRRRSLFVRLGSKSQGRDQPSASLGAADLARKAGACVAEKKAILLTREAETGVSAGQIGTVCVLTPQGIFNILTS
jgi:hypothetical protein